MFHADLDDLSDLLADLAREHAAMEVLADKLAHELALLHGRWDGAAAHAHLAAQADWDAGFAAMRTALVAMRSAAATARDNYLGAARSNVVMWEQVS
jgi:WXG100 family type VII secretion target